MSITNIIFIYIQLDFHRECTQNINYSTTIYLLDFSKLIGKLQY